MKKMNVPTKIKEIIDFYGCQRCGYCCELNGIDITKMELQTIIKESEELQLSLNYIEKQLHFDSSTNLYLIKYPCFLHKSNKCLIYQNRPYICKMFPFQTSVMNSIPTFVIAGYHFCPMATQIIDEFIDYAEENNVTFRWMENVHSEDSPFLMVAVNDFVNSFKKIKRSKKIDKKTKLKKGDEKNNEDV